MKKLLLIVTSLVTAITLYSGTVQNNDNANNQNDKVTEQADGYTITGVGDGW
jgi:uncharacterized protein YxeA